ncbi:MAG: hypothetical protein M3297_02750 [Thermoproteota archaeon]|nr:hypothetical protein [Thermoproteota archaeon]
MVRICPFCENGIEITEIKSYPDYSRKFFSCGHIDKPNKKDLSSHNDKMADLSPRISRDMNGENTVNISPLAAIVLTRLKQSKEVKIREKTISGKRWLQFSGESIRFAISNEEINIQLLETKFSERINPKHISNSILALSNEIKTNSIVREKERKKILGLFETLNNILVSEPKRIIIGRKWNFSLTSPYILKTIEILTGSSINE